MPTSGTSVKDLIGIEFDNVELDLDLRFPWGPEVHQAVKERRDQRPDGRLMIDLLMMEQFAEDGESA
jgi:hypothetical protein